MPWEERSLMDVRLRFVQDVHRPGWSVAEVCRRYATILRRFSSRRRSAFCASPHPRVFHQA